MHNVTWALVGLSMKKWNLDFYYFFKWIFFPAKLYASSMWLKGQNMVTNVNFIVWYVICWKWKPEITSFSTWHVMWLLLDTGLLYFQDFKNYIVNTHPDHNKMIAWEAWISFSLFNEALSGLCTGWAWPQKRPIIWLWKHSLVPALTT